MVRVKVDGKFVEVKSGEQIEGKVGIVSVPESKEAVLIERTRKQGLKKITKEIEKLKAGEKTTIAPEILQDLLVEQTRTEGKLKILSEIEKLKAGNRTSISPKILKQFLTKSEIEQISRSNLEEKRQSSMYIQSKVVPNLEERQEDKKQTIITKLFGPSKPILPGVKTRMEAIDNTARKMPDTRKKIVPFGVSTIKGIEETTGPDAAETRTPTPLSVEPFDPEQFAQARQRDATRLTGIEAISEIGRTAIGGLKSLLLGRDLPKEFEKTKELIQFEDVSLGQAFEQLTAPAGQISPALGTKKVRIPQFGTITEAAPTGVQEVTLFELERQTQIERGTPPQLAGLSPEARITGQAQTQATRIVSEFQDKVNRGELTVQQAQTQAQQKLKTTVESISKREIPGNTKLQRRTSQAVLKTVGVVVDVAAGLLISRGTPGAAARAVDRQAIKELKAVKPTKFVGTIEEVGDDAVLALRGAKGVPGARQEVTLAGKVLDLGDIDDVSIAAIRGRGKAKVTVDSFKKAIETFPKEKAVIESIDEFALVGKGSGRVTKGLVESGDVARRIEAVAATGITDIIPERRITREFIDSAAKPREIIKEITGKRVTSRFVGAAEDVDGDAISFVTGRAKKVRVSIPEARARIGAEIEAVGKIKKVKRKEPKSIIEFSTDNGIDEISQLAIQKVQARQKTKGIQRISKTILPGVAQAAEISLAKTLKAPAKGSIEEAAAVSSKLITRSAGVKPAVTTRVKQKIKISPAQVAKKDSFTAQAQSISQVGRVRQRGRQRTKAATKLSSSLAQAARAETKLMTSPAQKVRQKTKQIQKSVLPFTFLTRAARAGRIVKPTFTFKPKPLDLDLDSAFAPTKKPTKKKKREEAIFFTPGFIEKTFGIRKKITRKEARRIARQQNPLVARAIPDFVD